MSGEGKAKRKSCQLVISGVVDGGKQNLFGAALFVVVGDVLGQIVGAIWSVVEQSAKQIGIERFGAHVKTDNPSLTLSLEFAGTEGAGYSSLIKEQARELGIVKYVTVSLNLSEEQKMALLSRSDIFVSPGDSLQESFGISPIEAMAAGVPQIVSDTDGYRDTVVHGETGFLVPTYRCDCIRDLDEAGTLLGWRFQQAMLGQSIAIDVRKTYEYLSLLIRDRDLRARNLLK